MQIPTPAIFLLDILAATILIIINYHEKSLKMAPRLVSNIAKNYKIKAYKKLNNNYI